MKWNFVLIFFIYRKLILISESKPPWAEATYSRKVRGTLEMLENALGEDEGSRGEGKYHDFNDPINYPCLFMFCLRSCATESTG